MSGPPSAVGGGVLRGLPGRTGGLTARSSSRKVTPSILTVCHTARKIAEAERTV